MNDTPTPRTDTEHRRLNPIGEWNTGKINPDFARQLERELAEMQRQRDEERESIRILEKMKHQSDYDQCVLLEERDEARKDAKRLAKALTEYSLPVRTANDGGDHWCLIRNNRGASAMVKRVKSALAAHEKLTTPQK